MNKERPIIFNGEMVRAILDGRKTQTRRVIKPQPPHEAFEHIGVDLTGLWCFHPVFSFDYLHLARLAYCPYGKPGDPLWVRETFAEICSVADPYCCCDEFPIPKGKYHYYEYRADTGNKYPGNWEDADPETIEMAREGGYLPRWKPSIHMPWKASRIQLEVVKVRVERVQDITEKDAWAEGCVPFVREGVECDTAVSDFAQLWNEINEKRGFAWHENPWVWVVEFQLLEVKGGHKN